MIGDRTYQWAGHTAWGKYDNLQQNVIEHTFGYTWHRKKISLGTTTAVLGATATVVAGVTVTSSLTNPDVPRVLSVTTGGTTNDIAASTVTITGTNVEGKTISDVITLADNQTGTVNGALAFKTVSKVVLNKADGTGATFAIGTLNEIGLNHRIPPNYGTIVEVVEAQTSPYPSFTKPTVAAAPSASNLDGEFVEKNWVTSATAYDGTTSRVYYYWFHKVLLYPPKDSPEFYSTTTSTSTSSTSTSTTTSSTSTSTTLSSTSTSSTSSSTSSTSTSTTTLPI